MSRVGNDVIVLRGIWKRYGSEYVLEGVDLKVKRGSIVCIRGRSGIGKTTLVKIMALLLKPDRGEIYFNGVRVDYGKMSLVSQIRLRGIGYIPQTFDLIDCLTVRENIELPMVFLGIPKSERSRRVNEILKSLDLTGYEDMFPYQLSGGQQQRVAIARALVVNPKLLVADEPLSNIDDYTAQKIIKLFRKIADNGGAVIVTTTDMSRDYECTEEYILSKKLYPLARK